MCMKKIYIPLNHILEIRVNRLWSIIKRESMSVRYLPFVKLNSYLRPELIASATWEVPGLFSA